MSNTTTAAHGRWREILPALGIPTSVLNGKHQPCPMCGGKDRFRFTDANGEGDYYCSQCSPGRGLRLLMQTQGWDFKRAVAEVDKIIGNLPPWRGPSFDKVKTANPDGLRRLYESSQRVEDGDAVSLYLAKRNLAFPSDQWPKALRYVPLMKHRPSNTTHRGMLAVMTGPDDKPATIHRTYLTQAGEKAPVEPVRMFMPGRIPAGSAIRLSVVNGMMGIAEGIETALAARVLTGRPTWATTSATMLMQWQPPQDVGDILIFGDNDLNFTGQAAAYKLAERLVFEAARDKTGRKVSVAIPPDAGDDWNDVLIKRSKLQ